MIMFWCCASIQKAEAKNLKDEPARWLQEKLGLTQHPDKTHITHWDKRFRFLDMTYAKRNPNGTRWLCQASHLKRNENSKPK